MEDRISSDPAIDGDWASYYEKTGQRPPRQTLIRALDAFDREGRPEGVLAADLGCGSGRDTIEILRRGWPVHAVDASEDAIEGLLAREDLPPDAVIYPRQSRYEDMVLPPCDLINAAFSLPLCPPEFFSVVWRKICGALKTGGRFSGQLYGDRDSWAGRAGMTFHTGKEAAALLDAFEVEYFEEEEEDSVTPRGTPKHWHIFHIVAKKT
jgi:tellurite methyltransferase